LQLNGNGAPTPDFQGIVDWENSKPNKRSRSATVDPPIPQRPRAYVHLETLARVAWTGVRTPALHLAV